MRERFRDGAGPVLAGVLLLAGSIFLAVALTDFRSDQVSPSAPVGHNLCGPVGAYLALGLIQVWGATAFLVPVLLGGFGIALLRGWRGQGLPLRLAGASLLIPVVCGLLHLLHDSFGMALQRRWGVTQLHGLGGTLGHWLCGEAGTSGGWSSSRGGILLAHLEVVGSLLALLSLGLVAVALLQIGLGELARNGWYLLRDRLRRRRPSLPRIEPVGPMAPLPAGRTTTVDDVTRRLAAVESRGSLDANALVERIRARRRELGHDDASTSDELPAPRPTVPSITDVPERVHQTVSPALAMPSGASAPAPAAESVLAPRAPRRPVAPAEPGAYVLPDIALLDEAPDRQVDKHDAEKEETARVVEEVFREFDINMKVVAATRGPVITQYELELVDAGVRVGKVEGYEKDLSLKLGTEGIRIVAPLPNKKTVGIEVPNRLKQPVVMREIVEEIDHEQYTLPLILGRDVLGRPMVGDLAKMPHLLVAGATGMGKSVCMNAMICSVLLYRSPEHVKFIMVDPKIVELSGYEDIPHLLCPPITDMSKAHAALEWACKTMDERYFALRLVGVRNIADYNALGADEVRRRLEAKGKTPEDLPGVEGRMPYIIILVDEYADLMMVNKEVEKSIVRLTAKSRACGIHIILTTQRPSADVVTGLIKSNLPARIAFRVADKSNSRVILDAGGAENLLGKGDMLYLPPGSSSLVRGQGVWVKDHEIEAIIAHAKSQGSPEYDESITSMGAVAMAGGGSSGEEASSDWVHDRQFHEAVWSMYKHNKTGADFLRRKLNVGYNRATAIVEQMEDLGFVSAQKGTRPRELIKSWDDWLDLLTENGVQRDGEDEIYTNPFQ